MKSIRSKLLIYFFLFVVLFNVVSVSIYFSSSHLMNEYHTSFDRFLILNDISSLTDDLYENVNAYVVERDYTYIDKFYMLKDDLESYQQELKNEMAWIGEVQLNKYNHMIDTFIEHSELAIGFAIQDDIDSYSSHLQEAQSVNNYIQETTLELIDLELTEYQTLYQDIRNRNEAFKWFSVTLFTTTILLAILIAIHFSRGINRPVQQLTTMAKEVSEGKLDGSELVIRSNDELQLLGDTFNQMRKNIRQLITEIQEKSELDQLLKELELKHLQNQINPHFLFNTLNAISRMAYLEDSNETSKLINSVSSLLRYSLGDIEQSVTLRDEIRVVEDYFYIQNTRFSDRVVFELEVEDDCLDIEIPRLTLQPLVENAFIHGIERKPEGGKIRVLVTSLENQVIVQIIDDGLGIDERKIAQLGHDKDEEDHVGHSTGLGLKNVIRRLQLFYQSREVFEIESNPGLGTTVTLYLSKEEVKIYEGDDR